MNVLNKSACRLSGLNSIFLSRDKENLAVITDHGVIEKLAKLAQTEDDILRAKLAEAIANCCEWPGNRALFGQSGAVAPLVSYLGSNDLEVHRTTSVALFQLSKDPWNCVTMHQHGVVGHLLRLIGRVLFLIYYLVISIRWFDTIERKVHFI